MEPQRTRKNLIVGTAARDSVPESRMESKVAPGAEAGNKNPTGRERALTPQGLDRATAIVKIAAVLTGDGAVFFAALDCAAQTANSSFVHNDAPISGCLSLDEAAATQSLAASLVADGQFDVAALVCAAIAARTVVIAMANPEQNCSAAEAEALLGAWLEVTKSLAQLRKTASLLQLVPTARKFASRASESGATASEVADAILRVAGRISAQFASEGVPETAERPCNNERTRLGASEVRRRVVIREQVEFTLHTPRPGPSARSQGDAT